MRISIPWLWLSIGELTYLVCAPAAELRKTLAVMEQKRAPHPRAACVVAMFCHVVTWPVLVVIQARQVYSAIKKGWNSVK